MEYEKFSLREFYGQRLKNIFYGGGSYRMYVGAEADKDVSLASTGKLIFRPKEIIIGE